MAKSRTKRRSPRKGRRPAARRFPWIKLTSAVTVLVGVGLMLQLAWLDSRIRSEFEGRRWALPARIYAQPVELYAGRAMAPAHMERLLRDLGYQDVSRARRPGQFERSGSRFTIYTREFDFWDGRQAPGRLTLELDGDRIARLTGDGGRPVAVARLEPREIGRIYPAHHEDRVLVRLEEVPEILVAGIQAVEDRKFARHHGIDPFGIARALWANLRAGRTVQGGSTLTQQLVKNYFLSRERTLTRKVNEMFMALLLELRYDKDEILEAYFNEVFLGQQGRRAIHGFGLAARFYFGRPLEELELAHHALLIGMVRGPSYYDPRRHPERARDKRDQILGILAREGVVEATAAARAAARPLGLADGSRLQDSPHPAFIDLVRRQLRRDYRDEDLKSAGLRIFTTLDTTVQARAEEALSRGLPRLEQAYGLADEVLQGAVVVTHPGSGEVLAMVGGRDPEMAAFNRALDARRPIGSLVKPGVYLAALERNGGYHVLSPLDDTRVEITAPRGEVWQPRNYDQKEHGTVALAEALIHSYNLATVNLGMALGLPKVARALERLGLEQEIPLYPSLLLGAVDMAPVDVAHLYHTLASGGFRMPLRAIREITDAEGRALNRYRLSVEKAFEPGPVYIVNSLLAAVVERGTAHSAAARLGPGRRLVGKTGTTNDLRDGWFAGFGDDLQAVVWVGRDDNKPARLTGAQGALWIWSGLMARLDAASWPGATPEDVAWHAVDMDRRVRLPAACGGDERLPFLAALRPPAAPCPGGEEDSWWP
ncbi:MAG: penicillin-binding protein 1B [Gammaproteobacteria bacterium]|nr:penicillin-binding protein 1B [Gammaproteobacteria bacterium]